MFEEPCLPAGNDEVPSYGAVSTTESGTSKKQELSEFIDEQGWKPGHWLIIASVGCLKCFVASAVTSLPFLLEDIGAEFDAGRTIVALVAGSFLVGSILGTLSAGPLNDAFGRRTLLLAAVCFGAFFCLLHLVIIDLWHLMLIRALIGVCFGACVTVVNVYVVEFMPTSSRGWGIVIASIGWKVGSIYGIFLPWAFPHQWRFVLTCPSIPGLLAVAMFALCAPESPRWLLTQGRDDQGTRVLQKLLGLSELPNVCCKASEHISHGADCSAGLERLKLLFSASTCCVTVVATSIWFLNTSVSYAWGLWGPEILMRLSGAARMQPEAFIIAEVVSFVTVLGFAYVIDYLPRRQMLMVTCASVAFISMLMALLPSNMVLIVSLFVVMSIPWEFLWAVKIVYTKEAFATELRGTATGVVIFAGRIGGALVPIVIGWRLDDSVMGAVLIMAAMMLAAAVVSFFIPAETCQKKLQDVV